MASSIQNLKLEKYQNEKPNYEDDFDKFLASLPMEKGWRSSLYQFHGFWHHPKMLQGFLASQKHFHSQDSDIIMVTFPKCGTTWLKALLFSIINRNQHSPLSQHHPLLTKNPQSLVPLLGKGDYNGTNEPLEFFSATKPRLLLVSHTFYFSLLPKSVLESKCKLVYLARNPKDTLVSYWHFTRKTMPENYQGVSSIEEGVTMFCKGLTPCGPFWDHVLDYWKASLENLENIFFMTYEELQREPNSVVRRLADFLGYGFSEEEEDSGMVEAIVKLCSFENLSKLEVNSSSSNKVLMDGFASTKSLYRRGEVGDWKNHLNAEMADQLDHVTEEKFQGSGLLELLHI